jgi:hypothetical protein
MWTGAVPAATFTTGATAQWFYEVSSSAHQETCTDITNGLQGSGVLRPVRLHRRPRLLRQPVADRGERGHVAQPCRHAGAAVGKYSYTAISTRTFAGGGPGWNSAGTAVGTAGAC